MKMKFNLMLLLLGVSFIFLWGCKKPENDKKVTMIVSHTSFVKPIVLTGFFTAKGALNTSGSSLMDVHPAGDSIHCTQTMTTSEGSFTMQQDCSNRTMSGSWNIISGTGHYEHLQGKGTLSMVKSTDPSSGVLGVDTLTGEIW